MAKRQWGFACLDNTDIGDTAVINETSEINTDEDGAPLESVDADGEPSVDLVVPEVVQEAEEIEEVSEVIDHLDEVHETMENYRSYIVDAIENRGGLTQYEFEAIMIGMQPHVPNIRSNMPSNESFSYSRLAAATEALDSIKQGLISIWERIKDAVKTLYRKAKNWYLKTLDGAARLKKRAEAIAKQADKVTGSIAEKRINLSIHRTIFDDKGKAYKSGGDAEKPLERLARLIFDVLKDSTKAGIDAIDSAEEQTSQLLDQLKSIDKLNNLDAAVVFEAIANEYLKNNVSPGAAFNKDVPKSGHGNTSLYKPRRTDFLPGNKSLVLKIGSDFDIAKNDVTSGDISKFFRNIGIFLEEFNKDLKDTEGSAEYATLDTSNVRDITGHVETIADGIMQYRKQWEDRDKSVDKVTKSIDRLIKDVEADDDFNKHKQVKSIIVAILNGIKSAANSMVSNSTAIITYSMNVSKAYLLYCTRSLAQYKK